MAAQEEWKQKFASAQLVLDWKSRREMPPVELRGQEHFVEAPSADQGCFEVVCLKQL